jgi:hypothetical protein
MNDRLYALKLEDGSLVGKSADQIVCTPPLAKTKKAAPPPLVRLHVQVHILVTLNRLTKHSYGCRVTCFLDADHLYSKERRRTLKPVYRTSTT